MINCFIIDDEQHAIELIRHYVAQVPSLHLAGTATDPVEALHRLGAEPVDLIFLDIQMPGITGLDFVKAINGRSKVILTTAYSEFALEGYELDVVDFLLKPVKLPRFLSAVQKAARLIQAESGAAPNRPAAGTGYLFVKTEAKGKLLKVDLAEIDYIEGMSNYVAIHQGGKKVMVYTNMKDLEERLAAQGFVRVHRSFIVPVARISGIEGNRVLLKGVHTEILIGESYRAGLMAIINDSTIH